LIVPNIYSSIINVPPRGSPLEEAALWPLSPFPGYVKAGYFLAFSLVFTSGLLNCTKMIISPFNGLWELMCRLFTLPAVAKPAISRTSNPVNLRCGGKTKMNLLALKGEVSCKRCIVHEVRSVRKLFNYGVYYQFFVGVASVNRPEGRGIRPHCE
jgi:hypothetical protein